MAAGLIGKITINKSINLSIDRLEDEQRAKIKIYIFHRVENNELII